MNTFKFTKRRRRSKSQTDWFVLSWLFYMGGLVKSSSAFLIISWSYYMFWIARKSLCLIFSYIYVLFSFKIERQKLKLELFTFTFWSCKLHSLQKSMSLQRPKFLRSSANYQAINLDTLRAQNMESWPFFNQVYSTCFVIVLNLWFLFPPFVCGPW